MRARGVAWQVAAAFALVAGGLGWAHVEGTPRATACGEAGPFNFDTYEPEDYRTRYAQAIELATAGKAITFDYSLESGDYVNVLYQGLQKGPRGARSGLNTSLGIPPTIYKSIAWIEANWANASTTVPYGGVGPVLRSFDCGYGIGQITSGMYNPTGTATGRQAVIGTHYLFNIAEGIRILAEKWNSSPVYRPVAGNGDPAMLEDWYYAIWSYNGFAFSNHPLNPERNPLRGGGEGISPVYHCYDTSAPSYQVDASGAVMFGYGNYTYPERVYGCMRYPPVKGGARLWAAQVFDMPDFSLEEIAKAFDPKNFTDCQAAGFSGGCAAMDFPTTIKREATDDKPAVDIAPHADTTPLIDPSIASQILGSPSLRFSGDSAVEVTVRTGMPADFGSVVATNAGTGIGAFRIRSSANWVVVRHPGETRALDASVAIGREIDVVKTASPRVAAAGSDSTLQITVDPVALPPGTNQATVWLEPVFGAGAPFRIDVTAVNLQAPLGNTRVVPNLASDD